MRKFSHIRPNVWLLGCLTGWLALSVLTHAAAADWKPAPSPLMTRWGQAVTPDNAWREYPRPQMVRAEWQSLNGLWDYAVAPAEADLNPRIRCVPNPSMQIF